jgi:cellulose synthase/poly-beta-1,6-N-acetylglucosamine synthase-like glycosyltransferase
MIRIVFLVALVLIWIAVLRWLSMALAGAFLRRPQPDTGLPSPSDDDWPGVSLLIPAHNEEKVIEGSLRRYLGLDYPRHLLQVVVIDDGSTDATGAICDRIAAEDDRLAVLHVPAEEGGRGKASALNRGLPLCRHALIGVYDADNRPRAGALRALVADYMSGGHDAAIGRIVKINRRRTLLNRLSALDFVLFEWTFQAGRAKLFDVVLLPGTNYIIDADLLRSLGGWDPRALTEDLELSVRLYCAGHRVSFVPEAVSEEQDPEQLRVWVRQRTRWVIGNFYVLVKRTGLILRSRRLRAYVVLSELAEFYFLTLVALAVSQVLFYAGLAGLWHMGISAPLPLLWLLAAVVYMITLQLAAAHELEDTWTTPFLAIVMYLFYSPLWLFVFCRGLCLYLLRGGRVRWEKTPRIYA